MTIVIPVFNGAHVLPLTVDAVLSQPVERIVYVNDGSTDSTRTLLADVAERDGRVEVVEFGHNRGRASARNVGASGARGTVLFLDADVAPKQGYAEAMSKAMASGDVIACVGALRFPEADSSDPYHLYLTSSRRGVSAPAQVQECVPWRYFIAGVASVRADALKEVGGFPESIRYGEDLALACQLASVAPRGLAHAPEAIADLYDIGTLKTARAKLAAFAQDLSAVEAVCSRALGVAGLERLRSTTHVSKLAMSLAAWRAPAALCASILDHLPARIQPLAVRYLLGHTLVANARLDAHPRTP